MRIILFGTPDFAVPSLRALIGEGFDINAVVTQPDKPQGRSRSTPIPPPVKVVACEEDIPVLQPHRPSDPEFIEQVRAYEPDLGVVVAYGHILKPELLAVPRLGMVNVHASLLPKLRGAAPIQYALLEGLAETGVTIMQMEAGLDSGPIIHQVPTPVAPDETYGELSARLAELGALALVEALALMEAGGAEQQPQNHDEATLAPKITREVARIRWERSAEEIARVVRAMDPKPGAWSALEGNEVKLFGPLPADMPSKPPSPSKPGEIVETDPAFVVAAGSGALQFLDVQPAGRQRMAAVAWLRGRGAHTGQAFE
jgi:methionyl-tRNA formyltransferase